MRLQKFITESVDDDLEYFWEKLRKDCKPIIKVYSNPASTGFMYRGSYKSTPGIIEVTPRANRRPMSIHPKVQLTLDSFFKDKFGVAPRASGVFCTGSYSTAGQYGSSLYSVWPIGKFKFLWSKTISDLFEEIYDDNQNWMYWIDNPDKLKKYVDTYTDKDILSAIKSGHEIMLLVKKYYMILASDEYDAGLVSYLK